MVPMEDVKASVLRLKKLYFESMNFRAKPPVEGKISTRVGFKEDHSFDGNNIHAKLFCRVESKTESDIFFRMELCLCGEFISDKTEGIEKMLPNVFSIMFPYLRTQVTVMTSMPGYPSIVLPALNIVELLKKNKVVEK